MFNMLTLCKDATFIKLKSFVITLASIFLASSISFKSTSFIFGKSISVTDKSIFLEDFILLSISKALLPLILFCGSLESLKN